MSKHMIKTVNGYSTPSCYIISVSFVFDYKLLLYMSKHYDQKCKRLQLTQLLYHLCVIYVRLVVTTVYVLVYDQKCKRL